MSALLAAGDVVSHLTDAEILGPWFTHHHVLLIVVAVVMIVGFKAVARRAHTGTPGGFTSLVEVGLVFIRDDIVYPWLGEERGRKYLGYFWTLFFFILLCNLFGLFPIPLNPFGKTATGNIMVTAALALISFFVIQLSGMKQHGTVGYWIHLVPGGVPWWLWPLVWLVEFVGLFVKPFALTVRLFANMTAGHAIVAVLVLFLWGVKEYNNAAIGGASTIASLAFMLFIMLFETLVSLIQAYIFTILTAIFVSLAVAEEH
ncbi:MAG: F0F1 ATP synthase subunit A [Planctomycetota bacterium]|jgi:F-type H+-transporting ATPase subunit a